ncbi:hypothetical protein ASF27_09890 [Methylobacterium sp. Leaf102]|uniref:hypothetical protein n=1 Tax=unclassified Methylobacterium TaxID=2615210 RepID=UPI0006FFCDA0|nr:MULTISPECIES: hypothetical protein [unclassified Methylobacterium]KQP25236.1 hypothetical protein ASF27_09890 [Methylobacterium sp. Leaf102]KQP59023.1 hypothetical protein ASF52_13015 [Methylobacterium sp. Leaf112]
MTDTVGTASDTSPEALLKRAVMGARTKAAAKPATGDAALGNTSRLGAAVPAFRRIDPRLAGLVGAALLLGGVVGAGASRLAATGDDRATGAMADIQRQLGAAQAETERLTTALGQVGKAVAHTQETVDAARTEARTRSTAVVDRVARTEQTLAAKFATLSERFEQTEKDQAGRLATLTAQVEKRSASTAPAAVKPEPTVTGSLPDAKVQTDRFQADKVLAEAKIQAEAKVQADAKAQAASKPPASDNWAVREVYDGIAVLEDRKRRLVEVGIGDTVPGVGRIETIERRGRAWAVVTRQGVITPQAW